MRSRSSVGQSAFAWEEAPPEKPQFEPTDEQRPAIEHVHGPMLVVAGAGTGKTTVLTQRIAHLLETGAARADEILAITYTRNSAHDLVKRLAGAWLGRDDERAVRRVISDGIQVGTFHAYCYKLLCQAGRRFELVDDEDLYILLRRNLQELRLEHFIAAGNLGKFLNDLLSFFRRCSDELRGPADYETYVAKLERGEAELPRVSHSNQVLTDEQVLARCREIARVYRIVEDKLAAAGLGTYGDVISRAIDLLGHNLGQLERARARARFILIDEFQDSNVAQIKLAKLLGGAEANVFAVGDPDQAIYRFRGATSGAFDQFLATFGVDAVRGVTLTANRRSTEPVLKCAYAAISANPQFARAGLGSGKTWVREPLQHARTKPEPLPVDPVHVTGSRTADNEAAFVAAEIARMHTAGRRWNDIAVVYRQHFHRDEIIEQLRERGIPYKVEGVDLLETTEVRDLVSALQALQVGDAVALLRAAALPVFAIDGHDVRALLAVAGKAPQVESVVEQVPNGGRLLTALAEARHQLQAAENKAGAALEIVHRLFQIPHNPDTRAFAEFVERWSQKPQGIAGDGTVAAFLDYLELFHEAGGKVCRPEDDDDGTPATLQMASGESTVSREQRDAVHLMTVHTAKGLEFPVVFVVRLGWSSFPTNYREYLVDFPDALRNRENIPEGDPKQLHKEEERRLFYVAMTRAEDRLILCGRVSGSKKPMPAGYLRDLLNQQRHELAGHIEYRELAEGTLIRSLHASTAAQPRILDWVGLPPLGDVTRLRLSPSAIENYANCPLRYKLNLDWNLPEEPVAAMQYGAAVHTALMGYFDAMRKGKQVDPETVVASFLDEFAKAKIEEPLQRELYEANGRKQLMAFLTSAAAVPRGSVKLVEHKVALEIGGAEVVGRIDRVDEDDDGLTIVDYKTGRPKSQDIADKSLQLSIYALAMRGAKPVKAVVFENLEDNSTVETTRNSGDLEKAESRVADVVQRITAGEFAPRTGMHCGWCAYRMICPAHEVIAPRPERAAAVN